MIEKKYKPLSTQSDWSFELLDDYFNHLERIAKEKYNLDYYLNQIEVISSETMLDAYCSVGMPVNYSHWSYGKSFVQQQEMYKRGYMGLAYEIVINSNPCISYLMEDNTLMLQVLVMAHACFGHNSFFKSNYLFKEWTDADSILEYLEYAKNFISECEDRHGLDAVEEILDSCHTINNYGVDKYKRKESLSPAEEKKRQKERNDYIQLQLNDLWRTIPKSEVVDEEDDIEPTFPSEPQENILRFIEKNAPKLQSWQREIIRIVRKISQYFYPQMQTKLMNEGWATFIHFSMIHDLFDEGLIDQGFMMEFYKSHSDVTAQLPYNDKRSGGSINVYALGFAMFQDIKRICMEPTEEDREWFPDFAGNGDWLKTCTWAMKNFKDESFVAQFLSPKVIRDFRFFTLLDDEKDTKMEISNIHDKSGYKQIRNILSRQYNISYMIPDIQVFNVDKLGDRSMVLRHQRINNVPLEQTDSIKVLKHVARLWGYDVQLESVDDNGNLCALYEMSEDGPLLDIFLDD